MEKQILRITTVGNVDSGKSTLLGRILYETKCVYEDQLDTVKKISEKKGGDLDLSLLLDGLASEREQSITIDVAYRYFETGKRKFIVADNPGHQSYTRNMVTGASVSEVALVMIDAKDGLTEQSKRHIFITSLLQIKYLFVIVNKMDLVDYSQRRFNEIMQQYDEFSEKLNFNFVQFVPVSALVGDNVVEKSENTPWYTDQPLLTQLENNNFIQKRNHIDFRLPIQLTIKDEDRWHLGTIASGSIKEGDEVVILPNNDISKVKEIRGDKAVAVSIEDEIDISRGCMMVRKNNMPSISHKIDCYLCAFSDTPIRNKEKYILKHTTQTVNANIDEIIYEININDLHRKEADELNKNAIGRVRISTMSDLFFDPYTDNKITGSFILIDPHTYETVAAGMIKKDASNSHIEDYQEVTRELREKKQGHKSGFFCLMNFSQEDVKEIESHLFQRNYNVIALDRVCRGDVLMKLLDLGCIVLFNLNNNPPQELKGESFCFSAETDKDSMISIIKNRVTL